MLAAKLTTSSPSIEESLRLAFDGVMKEFRERLSRRIEDSLAGAARSPTAPLIDALPFDLDELVLESFAARLLDSRDSTAHVRRNALMRLLVAADAQPEIPLERLRSPLIACEDADESLTSAEAAKLLQVSRPHLAKLLDNQTIPGVRRLEGGHRRISKKAVLIYKAAMKTRQARAAEKVVAITEEMGLCASEMDGILDAPLNETVN